MTEPAHTETTLPLPVSDKSRLARYDALAAEAADMELEDIHERRVVRFIQRLAELAPETRP